MCSGFGTIILLPHDVDDVSELLLVSARKFFLFWSLGTPCVRTEDLVGLVTSASILLEDAGYSGGSFGDLVSSPGSRIGSLFLKVSWAFVGAAVSIRWDFILGGC
jgi:hypothetical protein